MKTTVVPAQITTVEDKIAGNLSFSQLMLLTAPVFASGIIFAFLPPVMGFNGFKLVLCVVIVAICAMLSLRIKGTIILRWFIIVSRYNLRPRYFVFNKNDSYLRPEFSFNPQEIVKPEKIHEYSYDPVVASPLAVADMVRLETVVADPKTNFHFRSSKRGGLRVHIRQVK